MTELLTSLFVAVLLGWVIFALSGLVMSVPLALILGSILGVLSVVVFRDTMLVRGFVALLGPIGIVLPLLAIRHVAGNLDLQLVPFGVAELLAFLVAYVVFLAASMGVIPIDLYRLGYAPLPVGIMAVALCAYGAVTGNLFVPLIAVAGQGLWLMGWGSSNWFDHILHALLVPIVVIVLIGRLT